jgi:hypothetical protein
MRAGKEPKGHERVTIVLSSMEFSIKVGVARGPPIIPVVSRIHA